MSSDLPITKELEGRRILYCHYDGSGRYEGLVEEVSERGKSMKVKRLENDETKWLQFEGRRHGAYQLLDILD